MAAKKLWIGLALAGIAVVGGYRVAAGALKSQVQAALGPESTIESIDVGFGGVTVSGLHIKAPAGWPAEETLSAERVTVSPSLLALLTGRLRVSSITVDKPYLSVLRSRDEKLRLLPSLLEGKPAPAKSGKSSTAAPEVSVGKIKLNDGVVEFFDASVRKPAHKLRLEQMQLSIEDVVVPVLNTRTGIDFSGVLKGVKQDGKITVGGWAEIASRDSEIKTSLESVDLIALQPYLVKAAETGVKSGSLNLEIKSEVRKKQLRAPGKLVIRDLDLVASGGTGTFMGMPREAVLFFLKDKSGKIDLDFELTGDIDNPSFSLNEAFATQIAAAMSSVMGISLTGVAEAIGGAGQKGVEAIGGAFKGLGEALKPKK